MLQSQRVFTNVSKGQFANSKDLEKAFQTKKELDVCKIILEVRQFFELFFSFRKKNLVFYNGTGYTVGKTGSLNPQTTQN